MLLSVLKIPIRDLSGDFILGMIYQLDFDVDTVSVQEMFFWDCGATKCLRCRKPDAAF